MAGIEAQAQFAGADGGGAVGRDRFLRIGGIFAGIGFCIQFDAIGAGFCGAFDHGDDGIHEKGDPDAGFLEAADGLNEVVFVTDRVPAVIGGDLV